MSDVCDDDDVEQIDSTLAAANAPSSGEEDAEHESDDEGEAANDSAVVSSAFTGPTTPHPLPLYTPPKPLSYR